MIDHLLVKATHKDLTQFKKTRYIQQKKKSQGVHLEIFHCPNDEQNYATRLLTLPDFTCNLFFYACPTIYADVLLLIFYA